MSDSTMKLANVTETTGYTYTTGSFSNQLTVISPVTNGKSPAGSFNIVFSTPVNFEDIGKNGVQSTVSLKDTEDNTVQLRIFYLDDNKIFKVIPIGGPKSNTTYTFDFDESRISTLDYSVEHIALIAR